MANRIRQVQHKRRSKKLPDLSPELRLALEKSVAERLEAEGYPVFLKAETAERHYPGEAEALHILLEINLSPKPKRAELLKSFRILRDYEEASASGNTRALAKALRTSKAVLARLERSILLGRNFTLGVRRDGLVVQPNTNAGMTAFALLSLFGQQRVSHLRECLHCRSWFFARFKHQQFCRDPFKKCQWSHYHTPEWRRSRREQNKKHQMEYRKRNPGRKVG
jgi:hypothetical protein